MYLFQIQEFSVIFYSYFTAIVLVDDTLPTAYVKQCQLGWRTAWEF